MAYADRHRALLEELRETFASGHSALGEQLLASALDAGVPWDQATRAVAEGIAERFGTAGSGAPVERPLLGFGGPSS